MAKPRVHELAKELDPSGKKITSKMILAWLKDQGEFVKAASSAVEPAAPRSAASPPLVDVEAPAAPAAPRAQAPAYAPADAGFTQVDDDELPF